MKRVTSFALAAAALAVIAPVLFGADAKKPPSAPEPAKAAQEPAAARFALPDPVAVVEGVPIKKEEVQKAFDSALAAQGASADALSADETLQGYQMVLDNLIVDKLLSKRSVGEKVSDADVETQFGKIAERFDSKDAFEKEIAAHGQTVEQVKSDIRESLRQKNWLDEQIKGKVEIPDADVEAYYKANAGKYDRPEMVRASHILVAVPEGAKEVVVAEKKKQAQAIADRVKKGEDFAKLAAELSEDPEAKETKGDLQYFSKEQIEKLGPDFVKTVFGMKKDELSGPIRLEDGFHIVKLVDHKAAGIETLDQVKGGIVAKLKRQKENDEVDNLVKGIRAKADIKVNIPEPAAATEAAPSQPASAATPPRAEAPPSKANPAEKKPKKK